MTDSPPLEDLGMSDVEYAELVTKGYEPVLERQLITLGEEPDQARKIARFVGLLQNKPPQTQPESKELLATWEDACGYRPDFN